MYYSVKYLKILYSIYNFINNPKIRCTLHKIKLFAYISFNIYTFLTNKIALILFIIYTKLYTVKINRLPKFFFYSFFLVYIFF